MLSNPVGSGRRSGDDLVGDPVMVWWEILLTLTARDASTRKSKNETIERKYTTSRKGVKHSSHLTRVRVSGPESRIKILRR